VNLIDSELRAARAREADLVAEQATRDAAAKVRAQYPPINGGVTYGGYGGYGPGGSSFLKDTVSAKFGSDARAAARLAEQQANAQATYGHELRDIGTSAFAGHIVPQFLVDEFAPLARASAPLLSAVRQLPLPPEGMSLEVSRLTTGTSVAAQATEGATIVEIDADDTLLSVPIRTFGGSQDISRQAIDRIGIDQLVFSDLAAAYLQAVDSSAINGTGAAGSHLGILNTPGIGSVAFIDASPTVAAIWQKLAQATSVVGTARFAAPDTILMHPRRWSWFLAALDLDNRPLISPSASTAANVMAIGAPTAEHFAGSMLGLDVIVDPNVPINLGAGTNEDVIIVLRASDVLLWSEGGLVPRQLRVDEPLATSTLQVRLVAYGYSAFTAGRYPSAICTVGGTGLVTPTFA
ncbi:MAG: phage major capsid protein, partial [Acidimicrobiia bacterium]